MTANIAKIKGFVNLRKDEESEYKIGMIGMIGFLNGKNDEKKVTDPFIIIKHDKVRNVLCVIFPRMRYLEIDNKQILIFGQARDNENKIKPCQNCCKINENMEIDFDGNEFIWDHEYCESDIAEYKRSFNIADRNQHYFLFQIPITSEFSYLYWPKSYEELDKYDLPTRIVNQNDNAYYLLSIYGSTTKYANYVLKRILEIKNV